jgi:phospholipase/carboxylesterase
MSTPSLLPGIEVETGTSPDAAVIWLHGLGADGSDFVPVVDELGLDGLSVRFVFPHAPTRPVTINGGYLMRAWYDIAYEDLSQGEDEAGLRESQAAVDALIAREVQRGVSTPRIVLAGFSQGGAIALQAGLRHPQQLAGIVALSTYLPLPNLLAGERNAANAGTPVLMAHGTDDPIVPLALARASQARLSELGYAVEWHTYRMPHSVCLEEIASIGTFLRARLSA